MSMRETIAEILTEGGIEAEKQKGIMRNLMNAINEDKRNAVVEAVNKQLDDFKDWKSPEEYKELEDKIQGIQEEAAKTTRTSKYQAKGINEKWHEYADSKLRDSKDFDKDLDDFIKNNPELLAQKKQEEKKVQIGKSNFGDTKTTQVTPPAPSTLREALAEELEQQK